MFNKYFHKFQWTFWEEKKKKIENDLAQSQVVLLTKDMFNLKAMD